MGLGRDLRLDCNVELIKVFGTTETDFTGSAGAPKSED